MSIPYSHHMKVYVGRSKDEEFKAVYSDNFQIAQFSFPDAESLRFYLSRISRIKDASLEIFDGAPSESKGLFKDENVGRIPAGEFLPIVRGLEKKCVEGRVDVVLI